MARIGLIADTHDEVVPYDAIADRVAAVFAGVELILHCGDLTTTAILDRLAELAPVVAVRSPSDPPPAPPRLLDGPHVLATHDVTIGLVNTLEDDPRSTFGRDVDVVVHGGTHVASVDASGTVLLVNPGSPTLADAVSVGILELGGPTPVATIVAL
jgi:uncharacterized protein